MKKLQYLLSLIISMLVMAFVALLAACGGVPLAAPEDVESVAQATVVPTATSLAEESTFSSPLGVATDQEINTPVQSFGTSPDDVEEYEFSKPKLILSGKSIDVVDWSIDSKNLLIARHNSDGEGRDLIETVDLNGHTTQSFGTWYVSPHTPIVLSSDNDSITFIGYDTKQNASVLRLVDKSLSDFTSTPNIKSMVSSYGGNTIWAVNQEDQIITTSPSDLKINRHANTSALSLEQFITKQEFSQDSGYNPPLSIAINPVNLNQAIVYDRFNFLLADLGTGQFTELDIGEEYTKRASGKYWALDIKWSPNGQQIAAVTTVGEPVTGFSNLTILDTTTWKYRRVEDLNIFNVGISWFPNSKDLLIRVHEYSKAGLGIGGLYQFNTVSLENHPLSLFSTDLVHSFSPNIYWSPDGQKIAMSCVSVDDVNFDDFSKVISKICLVEVTPSP